MLKRTKLETIAVAWAALCLALQIFVAMLNLQYDAGGIGGGVWWVSAVVAAPVVLTSEILGGFGIRASGPFGFALLTVVLGAVFYFLARFARRKSELR